jgi:hypothetical protein
MDLYYYNTIINTGWYLFTIVFLLYKFTTFFSHAYNLFKFCGKIISGGNYALNLCLSYFKQKNDVLEHAEIIDEDEQEIQIEQPINEGIIHKIKNKGINLYHNMYFKIFGKHHPYSEGNYMELPLYQSSNNNLNTNIINSYSKTQNYSSLLHESNKLKNNKNYLGESSISKMLHTIPLNSSYSLNYNTKNSIHHDNDSIHHENDENDNNDNNKSYIQTQFGPKPFGIDNSALLFNSSFIKNKLDRNNLPFALNSLYSTQLHPLQENEGENNDNENNNESDNENDNESDNENDNESENESENESAFISKYEECE